MHHAVYAQGAGLRAKLHQVQLVQRRRQPPSGGAPQPGQQIYIDVGLRGEDAELKTALIMLPDPAVYTTAPLRNRITVELTAPVGEVWELVGDHRRLPEYSAGIESVDVAAEDGARTCRFRATDETASIDLTERIRWHIPQIGYSASAAEPNPFQLTDDLSVVTVSPTDAGTVFEWAQYFNSPDLPAAVRSFDQGLVDIAEHLIARFGGQLREHWARSTGPDHH